MGDVLVARWWTKVLASDFGVFTCFGGLQSRLQSVLETIPENNSLAFWRIYMPKMPFRKQASEQPG